VKPWAAAAAFLLSAAGTAGARADDASEPRVTAIVGATSDAYEAVEVAGEVWAATSGGLVVVRDGRVVRLLGPMDGLPGTRLRSITVLPEGVWVGGVDGAALIARGSDGMPRVVRSVPLRRVRRVATFGGERYFATFGGGLRREDGAGHLATVAAVRSNAPVTDLLARPDGLYVATAGSGVLRIGASGRVDGRWRARRGLPDDVVWDLEPYGEHVIAATAAGVAVLGAHEVRADAPEARASQSLAVHDVRAIARAPGGWLVATYGGGVARIAGAAVHAVAGPAFARSVQTLANGTAIVASADGVSAIANDGRRLEVVSGGLPSADVTALAVGQDGLWIGTFDAGLAHLDAQDRVRSVAREAVDRRVNDLAIARDPKRNETLYVATDAGLFAGSGSSFAQVEAEGAPPREHVSALFADSGTGDLWAAGAHGLSRLHAGRWTRWASAPGGLPDQLDAVATDAAGRVWIGSLHGLVRFDPETGQAEYHDVASGDIPLDWVTACTAWDGGLAVGTYSGGLSLRTRAGVSIVRESDGLGSGWINPHAMRAIGGDFWLGTLDRGLVVGHAGAWRRFGLEAALPSADVTAIAADGDGGAWVGTRGGLARVTWQAAGRR
jgi:ligand-binding sensor domain-containing protein